MVQRLMGAPAHAITTVIDHLDRHPGGATGWLHSAGAHTAHLTAWRHRIATESEPPSH